MKKQFVSVTKEQVAKVLSSMVALIEKKGARNKMVSVFDIADDMLLDKQSAKVRLYIESCLDQLIKYKQVRYYVNEKHYIYFGVTKLGWEAWDAYQAAKQGKVTCKHCGKLFTARGISRHESACREKKTQTA